MTTDPQDLVRIAADVVAHTDGEEGTTIGWHVEWCPNTDFVYCGEASNKELDTHEEEVVDLDGSQFWLFIKDAPGDGMGRLIAKAVDADAAFELITAFRDARSASDAAATIARLQAEVERKDAVTDEMIERALAAYPVWREMEAALDNDQRADWKEDMRAAITAALSHPQSAEGGG